MDQRLAKQRGAELVGTFALCFVGIITIKHKGGATVGLVYGRWLIKESK